MKQKLSSVIPGEESPGFPPGDQVSNGHDMYYVHLLSREGVLETMGSIHIESKRVSRLPCTPQQCTTQVQSSVGLSGAESTKQAVKRACIRLRGSPHTAPFKLQRLHKLALPCLRTQCSYRKVFFFFCFKYQNYKNQFINCFSKTTTKTKQSPESKQNKILSKVLITLLLKLKPSAHSHVTGKRKGACSTW